MNGQIRGTSPVYSSRGSLILDLSCLAEGFFGLGEFYVYVSQSFDEKYVPQKMGARIRRTNGGRKENGRILGISDAGGFDQSRRPSPH